MGLTIYRMPKSILQEKREKPNEGTDNLTQILGDVPFLFFPKFDLETFPRPLRV